MTDRSGLELRKALYLRRGYIDCGCSSPRKAYRCGTVIRSNITPPEQAWCVEWLTAKRLKILAIDQKTLLSKIEYSELLGCDERCEGTKGQHCQLRVLIEARGTVRSMAVAAAVRRPPIQTQVRS